MTLILSSLLIYYFSKDKDKRKLVFAIGLLFAALSYLMIFSGALLNQDFASQGKWLLVPMPFAVFIAVFARMGRERFFRDARLAFYAYCAMSLVLFLANVRFDMLRIALLVIFMVISISGMIYLCFKTRDVSNLHFLLASLCFTAQGIV
jgi:hypothetical protein